MGKMHFFLNGAGAAAQMLGQNYNGIQFDKIQQVINALSGKTTVTKIEVCANLASLASTYRIDIENE